MRKPFVKMLAVCFGVLLVGCHGAVALEDAPAEMAAAMCPLVFECYGPAARLQYPDEAGCELELAAELADNDLAAVAEGLGRGTVSYDEGAMADCLDEVRERGCAFESGPQPEACVEAMEGLVEEGGECDFDVECAGDAICAAYGTCPGTCHRLADVGESCEEAWCTERAACLDGTCVALAAPGESCGGAAPSCRSGLICVGQDVEAGISGICRSADDLMTAAGGEACTLSEGPLCAAGLDCVITGLSEAGLETSCRERAASGGACYAGYPHNCPAGEYCDADVFGGTAEGTCRPLPAADEPCADAPFVDCAPGLGCDDGGFCRPRLRNGDACTEDTGELCYTRHCAEGVCAAEPLCP